MKSKELVQGMECYYHPSGNWTESTRLGLRVVVVDRRPGRWFRDRATGKWSRSSPHGQEVLVDLYASGGWEDPRGDKNTPTRQTVTLNTLRGPWEQTLRQHSRLVIANQTARRQEQDRKKEIALQCDRTVELLEQLGIKATVEVGYDHARVAVADPASVIQLAQIARRLIDIPLEGV